MLLLALIAVMTAMWPINRYATRQGARPEVLGMAISFFGMVLSIVYLLASGGGWNDGKVLLLGFFGGIAYAVGFFVLITACLKIGPIGLTTAMNNMGMIGPLVIGFIFFDGLQDFTALTAIGFAAILACLLLIAAQTSAADGQVSARWFRMALGGWLLSCASLGCQYLSSRVDPNAYLLYSVAYFATSFVILLGITIFRYRSAPNRTEIIAGLLSGVLSSLETPLSMYLVTRLPAIIVYPVSVTSPMILTLLIGRVFLNERLSRLSWVACAFGIVGMVALNL